MKLVEINLPGIYRITRGFVCELFFENPKQVWIVFYHDTLRSVCKLRKEDRHVVIENYPRDAYVFLSREACGFMSISCKSHKEYQRFVRKRTLCYEDS